MRALRRRSLPPTAHRAVTNPWGRLSVINNNNNNSNNNRNHTNTNTTSINNSNNNNNNNRNTVAYRMYRG